MKISFLYPCEVFILYCTVLKATVCEECYQEKCQLLSVTDNLILLDPFLGEHFGSLYFKIKNGSGRMSKTDCLNVKKECVWTCDSNTHDGCRKCKKEYCKQQTPGDFCGCIHADAFYPFETFEHYMKSSYDRRSEFGSSNLTSDSHYECCKRRKCGSAEYCTIGERLHEKEPSDKLLSSLELSLVISFIATVVSLCSMLFVFVIWSYSHPRRDEHSQKHEHTTQIPSNGLRLQRQRRRKRQNKNLNRVSKQTDNDTTEKNVHGSFNQNNNEATKQYVNKKSKLNDHKILEQSENCTVLLSAHREVSSTLNSVICVSQSQQTENPAAVSENEWCTSATRVKQYKFSHEAKYISQKEKTETEDCSEHSGNSIEIERVIIPLSVQEGLFENNDSSGKSAEFDSETTAFPKFCGQSSAKQTHECSQNSIEDVERQLVAKEISRELHIEHRNLTIFGLDSYFDRLNNGPPPTTRERMQYEWIRLASFHNYTGNGNALALARNGFYHDHNEGPMSTRCYLCEARRSDWEMFDDISAEHRRQSPNCPFHDNREEETLNISITNGDHSETPARSSRSSIGSSVTSSVTSSSSMSTGAATVREVSSSFQGINISQTNIGNSRGESIPLQPTEDPESRDRSLLALSQPRTQRALGRTGHSYSTIIAPRRNNVATGAVSNIGIGPFSTGSSSSVTMSQLPSTRPSSILGGPVGAGAFSGLRTAGPSTGALTSVPRATEGLQQSNTPSPSAEAAAGTRQTNPAPGAGGRTDPTITVVVDNPKHPDYVNIDSRVSSYQGWPDYLDQTPRQMSEAGFFYVGVADFTRCYCCGGGLRNWEPGDDPMLEHTRWFPRCEYVNKLKGERYVAAVQRRHQEHMAEQQRQQIEIAQRRDENRNPPDPMTTEAAAVMREMGYSADRTREAILAVRRQTGSSMVTTQQVLTWLLDDEERRLTGNSSNTELGIRPPPTSTATSLVGTSTPSSVVYTGTSIPSSIVHTGTSIGTFIVNTTSSISTATSIVSAGTATSTVSSSSASVAAEVKQSGTSASVTAGESSSASQNQQNGSGNSSSSNSASRTSIEKQSGASGDASDESKSTAKEDAATAKTTKKKNAKKKAKNKAGAKSETNGATGGDFDAKSLKAENEKLREMQTCKICMERAVNTTLLPCGHLVCCDTCAARLQRCPICRKRIKGTVKTFMS